MSRRFDTHNICLQLAFLSETGRKSCRCHIDDVLRCIRRRHALAQWGSDDSTPSLTSYGARRIGGFNYYPPRVQQNISTTPQTPARHRLRCEGLWPEGELHLGLSASNCDEAGGRSLLRVDILLWDQFSVLPEILTWRVAGAGTTSTSQARSSYQTLQLSAASAECTAPAHESLNP